MSDALFPPAAFKRIAEAHGLDLSNVDARALAAEIAAEVKRREPAAYEQLAGAQQRIELLEHALEAGRRQWQRVLRAYLALRDVKELTADEPHTPAYAKLIFAERALSTKDLKVSG